MKKPVNLPVVSLPDYEDKKGVERDIFRANDLSLCLIKVGRHLARMYSYFDWEASVRDRQIHQIQETEKKRNTILRQRIHRLEQRLNKVEYHGITRGKSETQQASSS